jgi:GxxExxY protein
MSIPDCVRRCAEDVQSELGSGHRENAYQKALLVALADEGVQFTSEATIPVLYRGMPVARMHPDLIVGSDDQYILELKVDRDGEAQCRRYIEHADRTGMDDVAGGLAISFGSQLDITEL